MNKQKHTPTSLVVFLSAILSTIFIPTEQSLGYLLMMISLYWPKYGVIYQTFRRKRGLR